MIEREDVEFPADGAVTLRGWLFLPDGPGPHPAITMAHGYAGVKEHGLEPFARAFAEDGFVVLVHGHRTFGSSDGEPRQDVDPWQQIADWRRAISYLEKPAGGRRRPDRPVGQQLCRRARDRTGCHRPPAARRGLPGADRQRVRAGPAPRRTRRRAGPRGVLRRGRAGPIPRRGSTHGGHRQQRSVGARLLPIAGGHRLLRAAHARRRVGEQGHGPFDPPGAHVRCPGPGSRESRPHHCSWWSPWTTRSP